MKPILLATVLFLFAPCMSCGSNGSHDARGGRHASETSPFVVGTVIDAATGEPVANVKVEAPNGRSTRSDAHGRFEFKNLEIGTEGDISAAADDGRKGRIALRRLGPGRLEVVLHLTSR